MVLHNLQNGLNFLFNTQILHSLLFVSIPVLIAFGLSYSLLLPFTNRALNTGEIAFGLQEGLLTQLKSFSPKERENLLRHSLVYNVLPNTG